MSEDLERQQDLIQFYNVHVLADIQVPNQPGRGEFVDLIF